MQLSYIWLVLIAETTILIFMATIIINVICGWPIAWGVKPTCAVTMGLWRVGGNLLVYYPATLKLIDSLIVTLDI